MNARFLKIAALCLCAAVIRAEAVLDRACLNGFVDQYLSALVTHDASKLPLTTSVKYTENGQTLKLGDGMWGVANRVRDYKLTFADPKAGQAGVLCVVEENGHPQILALRLKIENKKISEIEAIIARTTYDGGWSKADALVTVHPIFTEVLAPAERRSREEMTAITDSYFEGLERATGKLTPFDPQCTRIENGVICANDPNGNPIRKMTAKEQFDTGFSTFITHIRERRFPVVDEERGLVYSVIFFDHAGKVRKVKMNNGVSFDVPPPYDAPYTWMIGELFKIKDGKIHRIEAVLLSVPYGMPSGWVK